jgi:hypothetical protein
MATTTSTTSLPSSTISTAGSCIASPVVGQTLANNVPTCAVDLTSLHHPNGTDNSNYTMPAFTACCGQNVTTNNCGMICLISEVQFDDSSVERCLANQLWTQMGLRLPIECVNPHPNTTATATATAGRASPTGNGSGRIGSSGQVISWAGFLTLGVFISEIFCEIFYEGF